MSRIRILPEIVANKIAAGEMVERPASVLKELMENALDAGATRLIIDIENGGRRLIQVADNGMGMEPDDALLAIERFATSKVPASGDLFEVQTLGFRGEALPSIAAVSRFTLVTRPESAQGACRLQINGGKLERVEECGAPPGTLVSVRDLFFNTPARRKFLKTVATEIAHISDLVNSLALGYPQTSFCLRHNGRLSREWPTTDQIANRVRQILGSEAQHQLHHLQSEPGPLQLEGWLVPPPAFRNTPRSIYLFVNGRLVRDRIVQHALLEGCQGRLTRGQYPLAVLWLTLPSQEVDINVHPTKQEVRFLAPNQVHELVARGVNRVLTAIPVPWQTGADAEIAVCESASTLSNDGSDNHYVPFTRTQPPSQLVRTSEVTFGPNPGSDAEDSAVPGSGSGSGSNLQSGNETETQLNKGAELFIKPNARPQTPPQTSPPKTASPPQASLWSNTDRVQWRVIGQFQQTYLICETPQELLLVDQHAAHERILYEKLRREQRTRLQQTCQPLLLPETVDLTHEQADILQQLLPDLASLGIEVEGFGGQTFVIKSVPAFLADGPVQPLLLELIEKTVELGFATQLENRLEAYLKLLACHGAIRARQTLAPKDMQQLLKQLEACENPANCPHGRPVWLSWSRPLLDTLFKR